jgi:transposase
VTEELQKKGATLAGLRRLLGITLPKRTSQGLGREKEENAEGAALPDAPSPDAADTAGAANAAAAEEPENPPAKPPTKPRAKGHGRLPTSAYEPAETIFVPHPDLQRGTRCPGCAHGKLHAQAEPSRVARIFGQAPLVAVVWHCERLRCGGCGQMFVAPEPEEARGPKYSESAVSMMAILHYGTGLPLHRLARLQQNLRLPMPASTQWQVLQERLCAVLPAYGGLVGVAADADLFHTDDTHMGILELMGKRRAQLEAEGLLPAPERTGLYTTGLVAQAKQGPIALFMTGRKHAGENLRDLLDERDGRLPAPVLMSDGLDRNAPKGHDVVEAKCLQHARTHVVEQKDNFPAQCGHVLGELKKVFKNEQHCKKTGLEGEERRRYHEETSGPIMKKLKEWMEAELEEKRVEPNSGLGQALNYMLKRWEKLTAFLRVLDAPLENNRCE